MIEEKIKETEFNSSVACLIRIDNLMKTLHQAALNLIPEHNNSFMYCITLLRLYKEGKSKFSNPEKTECEKFVEFLHNKNIYPSIYAFNLTLEIIKKADEFEDYLIDCLDKHNMLLANKDLRLAAAKTG